MRFDSVIDAVGHTPLVRLDLSRAAPGARRGVEVYAKLEMQNLYGMKDRVAARVIRRAVATGELLPGAPIVESSSGTMALGLALVGRALGHPVHITTDARIDPITLAKLRALGAVVHIATEPSEHGGWQRVRLDMLHALLRDLPGAFWPQQYSNPQNPQAYAALAAELLADLDGRIDVLVGAVGSGGSLCGTARALRAELPDLFVVGIDCVGSVLFHQPDRAARLQSGLGNSLMPPNLDHGQIDEVHWLNDREAFEASFELAGEQALFGGNTSGSVYRVLGHVARRAPAGARLVGVLPDRGDRYHSTVYDKDYWRAKGLYADPPRATPLRVRYGTPVQSWSFATCAPGALAAPAGEAAPTGNAPCPAASREGRDVAVAGVRGS